MQDDGDVAEWPVALLLVIRAVLAKINTCVAQVLIAPRKMRCAIFGGQTAQLFYEGLPDRTHVTIGVVKLVRHAALYRVILEQCGVRGRIIVHLSFHETPGARRKSSVVGNSGCGVSEAGV